nr:hypothetical protein [Tanacetum cinerariifolium]
MVASDSGSPLQPSQAHPGKNDQLDNGEPMRKKKRFPSTIRRGLKGCASRSTLHPFMNALEMDNFKCVIRGLCWCDFSIRLWLM